MVYGISASVLQNYFAFMSDKKIPEAEETSNRFSIGVQKNEQEQIEEQQKAQLPSNLIESTYEEYIKSYFHNYLEEALQERMKMISKDDLVAELKTLITQDDDEEVDNSEEIAALTNLIAEFDTLSRGEDFITPKTLSASTNVEA